MNIICAAAFCFNMLGLSAAGIGIANSRCYRYYRYSYSDLSYGKSCSDSVSLTQISAETLLKTCHQHAVLSYQKVVRSF